MKNLPKLILSTTKATKNKVDSNESKLLLLVSAHSPSNLNRRLLNLRDLIYSFYRKKEGQNLRPRISNDIVMLDQSFKFLHNFFLGVFWCVWENDETRLKCDRFLYFFNPLKQPTNVLNTTPNQNLYLYYFILEKLNIKF